MKTHPNFAQSFDLGLLDTGASPIRSRKERVPLIAATNDERNMSRFLWVPPLRCAAAQLDLRAMVQTTYSQTGTAMTTTSLTAGTKEKVLGEMTGYTSIPVPPSRMCFFSIHHGNPHAHVMLTTRS